MEPLNLRKEWFLYVAKIKRKNKCSHKEAMSLASTKWPAEKEKLKRKFARELKKSEKNQESQQ